MKLHSAGKKRIKNCTWKLNIRHSDLTIRNISKMLCLKWLSKHLKLSLNIFLELLKLKALDHMLRDDSIDFFFVDVKSFRLETFGLVENNFVLGR